MFKPFFSNNDLEIIKKENLYNGFFSFKKYHFKHKLFKGGYTSTITREILEKPNATAIVAYDPNLDKVALIEQIRIGTYEKNSLTGPWMLELIAGIVDTDENPEQTIIREAIEEASLHIQEIMPIMTFFESPGASHEKIFMYAGKINLQGVTSCINGVAEENEDIKLHIFSRREIITLLKENKINNSIALIGLQWLLLNYQYLQEKWSTTK